MVVLGAAGGQSDGGGANGKGSHEGDRKVGVLFFDFFTPRVI